MLNVAANGAGSSTDELQRAKDTQFYWLKRDGRTRDWVSMACVARPEGEKVHKKAKLSQDGEKLGQCEQGKYAQEDYLMDRASLVKVFRPTIKPSGDKEGEIEKEKSPQSNGKTDGQDSPRKTLEGHKIKPETACHNEANLTMEISARILDFLLGPPPKSDSYIILFARSEGLPIPDPVPEVMGAHVGLSLSVVKVCSLRELESKMKVIITQWINRRQDDPNGFFVEITLKGEMLISATFVDGQFEVLHDSHPWFLNLDQYCRPYVSLGINQEKRVIKNMADLLGYPGFLDSITYHGDPKSVTQAVAEGSFYNQPLFIEMRHTRHQQ